VRDSFLPVLHQVAVDGSCNCVPVDDHTRCLMVNQQTNKQTNVKVVEGVGRKCPNKKC
jgi:hypothetical protein